MVWQLSKNLSPIKAKVIATDMVDVPGVEHSNIMDVSSEERWNAVVEYAKKEFGGIDILVNCAGIMRKGLAEETSSAMWDEVLNVNLKGVFLGCKTVIPVMRERGGGAIVNVASIDAIRGNRRHVAYAESAAQIALFNLGLRAPFFGIESGFAAWFYFVLACFPCQFGSKQGL